MSPSRRARGFAAVLAIAVVVMVGALGAGIALMSFSQQSGSAGDILGTKAYFAARAGLEWGVHHVLRAGPLDCAGVNGSTFALPAPELAGFRVTVGCTESSHEEGSTTISMFVITATGCNDAVAASCSGSGVPASVFTVERQLRVLVGSN